MDLVTSLDAASVGLDTSPGIFDAQQLAILDPDPIIDYVDARHRFPDGIFDDLVFLQASRKSIRSAHRPLDLPKQPSIDRVGIAFLRIDMANPRMTTSAAMTWANEATHNVVDTDRQQCLRYLRRSPIELTDEQRNGCSSRGFVLIRHRGHGLGTGFVESTRPGDENCGHVRSLYPRAYSDDVARLSPFGHGDE